MAFAPIISAVAGTAGALTSAFGAWSSGKANANMANYQAQVATNNATIAGQNADYAIASGLQRSQTQSLKGASQGGRLKASQAANGVDVNSGSAVDVQVGAAEANQLDTETVLNNAQLAAYGYRSQQTNYEAEAALDKSKASSSTLAAALSAGGSLLGNASSIGGKWGGGESSWSNGQIGTFSEGGNNGAPPTWGS
jgi:hypothetical protein